MLLRFAAEDVVSCVSFQEAQAKPTKGTMLRLTLRGGFEAKHCLAVTGVRIFCISFDFSKNLRSLAIFRQSSSEYCRPPTTAPPAEAKSSQ